jgi:S1-C subfamily serine protease
VSGWRDRLLGGEDRLGWWLLPLFLIVGLAGTVLAGSLAVVYYGQQVDRLRSETAEAREAIMGAADEVREVADEALEAMEEEAAAFRERQVLPVEDAADRGVVRLQVATEITVQRSSVTEPRTAPAPDDEEAEAGDPEEGAGTDLDDDPGGEEAGAQEEPPPPPPTEERVWVARASTGFVVVRDGEDAFIITSFSLLADPRRTDVPLDVPVTVRTVAGETSAEVHSWDAERDLLLLRARLGAFEPLEWRPADEPIEVGDRIVGLGLTSQLELVRVGGELASAGNAFLSDLPALATLAGGPVVDHDGRVVGISSLELGGFRGDPVIVPVRALCDRLLASCPP